MGVAWLAALVGAMAVGPAVGAPSPPSADRGAALFATFCASCHGTRGDGHGVAAGPLDPKPRDFTSGIYKFRSTPSHALPTDSDLRRVIRCGLPGTWMPGWEDLLNAEQVDDLVAHLKALLADDLVWQDEEPIADAEVPTSTPESLRTGRGMYFLFECSACHGTDGRGKGPSAPTLKDYKERPIQPTDLARGAYRAGTSAAQVRKTFLTGIAGTPMPAYTDFVVPRDALTDSLVADLPEDARQILAELAPSLPAESDLAGWTEEALGTLSERHQWALVHYVRSLQRGPTWRDWLLTNPEDVAPCGYE